MNGKDYERMIRRKLLSPDEIELLKQVKGELEVRYHINPKEFMTGIEFKTQIG